MTPDEIAQKIDKDRKKRERELLLLLLLLSEDAESDVTTFIRHGQPYQPVLNNVFTGPNGQGGAIPLISQAMAEAHTDAVELAAKLSGVDISPGTIDAIAAAYKDSAVLAGRAMANTLARTILDLQTNSPDLSDEELIQRAFETAGYSKDNPFALEAGVERSIVTASNAGMLAAGRGDGVKIVEAFRHASVLDDGTTDICRERDGLTLDSYDAFWLTNCPPLHFGCRSVLVPIFGEFTPSESLPGILPDPGFGIAPAGIYYL